MGMTRAEALALQTQAEDLLTAAEAPDNAAARDKLRAEDYTDEEHVRGKALLQEVKSAQAGATAAPAVRGAATALQSEAMSLLMDVFGKRVKKTRAKLQEREEHRPLITVLNRAVRRRGNSAAALGGRVEAYLQVIEEEIPSSPTGASLTIRQAVNITPAQVQELQDALAAFRARRSDQDDLTADALELSADKQAKLEALDRWLAKWQHIAKADFTRAELVAFGIPVNTGKARRRSIPGGEPTRPG